MNSFPIKFIIKGAQSDHIESVALLAQIYFNGSKTINRNTSLSLSYFTQLSKLSASSDTLYHLGLHYALGLGTRESAPLSTVLTFYPEHT